ncbi:MAG TPA: leucine--tRNA ligase [Candidatus Butyricicoccus avistercoris]|uniref:Leucine--tRNA ligase n=1 Tax=Candidatus Butyricicoccus avistercoris TaxID=2838518 RepID=A0A9D1TGY8_9FIRM|nr:leucine--tRNA ligase [Candidatus Butyricicoccus avistercoris]
MNKYEHKQIEKKWQDIWDEKSCFVAPQDYTKPKFYALVEFPYPSGQGLHVGHPRSYTALDIVARKKRMQGFNVLYPMGWDAFGLPTENFAIKNHVHPADVTKQNVARFKSQLKALGLSFDWSREINTTDPNYYKWTQWIFLQLFKKGLAYKKEMNVNWCTSCKCVLANEEVVNGVCERCGSEVVHKTKSQWMLKITEYAQRLIDDLDEVDFIERVKIQQKNWIGRSTGAEVDFKTTNGDTLTVYTTRPDTLFGATYMVISPEHPIIEEKWADKIKNIDAVRAYREEAARKSDFERTELNKEKTGVCLDGVKAVNPVNGNEIPIFVSDYVLMGYGTGAIMAVPAHDDRDWEFAKAFGCEIIEVVSGGEDVQKAAFTAKDETGILVNSDFLNGKTVKDAIPAMISWLEEKGIGHAKVQYKLRDWVFSRQRYWGEPIPIIWCDKCGWVPVPEDQLPLTLPNVDSYEPTENGESPLAKITDWVNTTCPCCGAPAKRETDTMPQWAGSSWYFLRYMDPKNNDALASKEAMEYWGPVDWYNGGMEHTTLHLLYSRFWHKFLYDIGVVPTKEPYAKRTSHGMILGENGEKMSKSRGNVVNPDEIVETYGADTMRLYEMFIGDFEKAAPWSPKSIKGCRRFVERVWNLFEKVEDGEEYSKQHEVLINKTIKKVGEDIENLKANTAIAAMMSMVNDFYDKGINKAEYKTLLKLVCPFAPHVAEELWSMLGETSVLSLESWPEYDENKTQESSVQIAVQVNGKLRATISLPVDCEQQLAIDTALADEKVQKAVEGKSIVKTIVVKNKIVNLVVK